MGESNYEPAPVDEDLPYARVEPMLPQGESRIAYKNRVGPAASKNYSIALAFHRLALAEKLGINLDQLHDSPLASLNDTNE